VDVSPKKRDPQLHQSGKGLSEYQSAIPVVGLSDGDLTRIIREVGESGISGGEIAPEMIVAARC
jgi:hypothetical protein